MPSSSPLRAAPEDLSKPVWNSDRLDSPFPPTSAAPYFDESLAAWVLSRHADVAAAFRSTALVPAGPRGADSQSSDAHQRLNIREETLAALHPAQLKTWEERLASEACTWVDHLPNDQPVDLIGGYARPLCLTLAAMVTGIDLQTARSLEEPARRVSAAAAEPFDPALRSAAKSANHQLTPCFHSPVELLRDSGFVALSQTLPCILGNAWFALLNHPLQWRLLHDDPDLTGQAIEELLRYAGLVRVIFRVATEDVSLNGISIRNGDRVILRIVAANRDPERFPDAHQLDIHRRGAGHLTLGSGPHSCVGASLIRMGAITITRALVTRFSGASLVRPATWQGGSIFSSPASLFVQLATLSK